MGDCHGHRRLLHPSRICIYRSPFYNFTEVVLYKMYYICISYKMYEAVLCSILSIGRISKSNGHANGPSCSTTRQLITQFDNPVDNPVEITHGRVRSPTALLLAGSTQSQNWALAAAFILS